MSMPPPYPPQQPQYAPHAAPYPPQIVQPPNNMPYPVYVPVQVVLAPARPSTYARVMRIIGIGLAITLLVALAFRFLALCAIMAGVILRAGH